MRKQDASFRHHSVKSGVARAERDPAAHLQFESEPERRAAPAGQKGVVKTAAETQTVSVEGKRQPWNQDQARPIQRRAPDGKRPRLGYSEAPRNELSQALDPVKLDALLSRHTGQSHGFTGLERGANQRTDIHFAAHGEIGEYYGAAAIRRKPLYLTNNAAAAPSPKQERLTIAQVAPERTQSRLLGGEGAAYFSRHRPDFTTRRPTRFAFVAVALLPLLFGGCLPLLLGNAKTLKPGDYSLAIAGMARTHAIPASVKQTGTFSALVDLRGGLIEGVEAGLLLQVPSHVTWDLKGRLLRESGPFMPAVALRAHLGVIQPSFGASLLATKTFGRAAFSLMAGASRTNERLWREGSSPFSGESESFVKRPLELGAGVEYRVSPLHYLFCDVITWDSDPEYQVETPKNAPPFGVIEDRNWFFAAGMRIRWTPPPKPKPAAVSVALRGRVLKQPDAGQFEVGQPGIYTAVVYVDAHTRVLKDGKPVKLEELTMGRAVLIQGLPLPRPATFLARTIELQQ